MIIITIIILKLMVIINKSLFVFKTFVLSIFKWLLKTGFTVYQFWCNIMKASVGHHGLTAPIVMALTLQAKMILQVLSSCQARILNVKVRCYY